jgi:hypothetical protein
VHGGLKYCCYTQYTQTTAVSSESQSPLLWVNSAEWRISTARIARHRDACRPPRSSPPKKVDIVTTESTSPDVGIHALQASQSYSLGLAAKAKRLSGEVGDGQEAT